MGQKTHPIGFRIGVNRKWSSTWYAKSTSSISNYANLLHEDLQLRKFIKKFFINKNFLIDEPIINRKLKKIQIIINLYNLSKTKSFKATIKNKFARLKLKKKLKLKSLVSIISRVTSCQVSIKLGFVKKNKKVPLSNAHILALYLSKKMKSRKFNLRRQLKMIMNLAKRQTSSIRGIAIKISGRIRGKARAKSMITKQGKIALQSLNTKIDFGTSKVITKFGVVGIKVWVAIKNQNKNNINYRLI
jgi:small subunit ribosomal protein S3